ATGKRVQALPLGHYNLHGVAFSGDERRVAVADSSSISNRPLHRVLVWDLETSKSQIVWSEQKNFGSFYFYPVVALSPDGRRLLACHFDWVLRCWEVEGGKLLWESEQTPRNPVFLF